MKQLVKTVYGSHLYGLDTPSSDKDYKGVFLPSIKDVLMYGPKKTLLETTGDRDSRNSSEDVDFENITLQFFLKMACSGQTIAIDMLHTPYEFTLETSWEWEYLRDFRDQFYTSEMEAYLKYCQNQAAKYGIKGSRMNAVKSYVDFLSYRFGVCSQSSVRLIDVWGDLPRGEHIEVFLSESNRDSGVGIPSVSVCGRIFQSTVTVGYALEQLNRIYDNYGERARQAQNNNNIDWKAISHAFRAGLELKEIYETGDLIFPLKDRNFLMKVKTGAFHYQNDGIATQLEELIEEIKELAEKSPYPKKCDLDKWKDFVFDVYNED